MKLESYWLATAPPFREGMPGPAEGVTDVVVVGGGFTGLSAARAFAKRGVDVVLFEAGQVIGEASGRNGGHCNGGLAHDYASLMQRHGVERTRNFHDAYCAAVDSVESLCREEAIECDFRRGGRLKLAAKPAHYDRLARSCELLRKHFDSNYHLIAPAEIHAEVDSPAFHGGLLHDASAQLHVGKFGVALASAAARHGARIYENAPVIGLERKAGKYRVRSTRGEVECSQVLVATGSTSVGPFGWFRRRLAPVGSFIIVTQPLEPGVLDRLIPHRRSYVTSRHVGNYFRGTPDGRLLFGGRARFAMSSPHSDAKSGHVLRATLAQVFPQLRDVSIEYCWGGLVDITADRLPRAGEHDGVHYSMGYSGHGVQMSVHMGQRMAEVMLGRPEANPWRGLEWPAIPGHLGKPWFLPLVGAYYRTLDLLT